MSEAHHPNNGPVEDGSVMDAGSTDGAVRGAAIADKPWSLSWSLMGVWMVECGRQGDGYGHHSGHLTFASDDKPIASLIAAAPDLLAALRTAVADLEQTLTWRGEGWECSEAELLGEARAAIAKAEGRS